MVIEASHPSPLNVDHHASAFHRVANIGGNADGQQGNNNVNNSSLDHQNAVFAHPTTTVIHHHQNNQSQQMNNINALQTPSSVPIVGGHGQHHQLLLALIQQQLKGAASGGSTSATVLQSDSNNNNQQQNCGQLNFCGRIPHLNLNTILHQNQQRMNAQTPAAQSAGGNGGKGPPQNDGQNQTSNKQIEPKNEAIQMLMDQSTKIGGIQNELLVGQKIGSTANLGAIPTESPCGGCRELKREVEELRQMLFQMQQESGATISSSIRLPTATHQSLLKPQSPPSPPHPSLTTNQELPLSANHQHQQATNQQLRQALLQQQTTIHAQQQQGQQFTPASGNTNNSDNSHILQMFLSQTNQQQQQSNNNAQQQQHPPTPQISSSSTSSNAPGIGGGVGRMLDQLGSSMEASRNAGAQQMQWAAGGIGAEKQQQQLLASTIQMLQQAAQIQQINTNNANNANNGPSLGHQHQMGGSGTSTRNNSIQSGESVFFDPSSGIDVSETSSSASSTNTQMMLQSPPQIIDVKPAATILQQLQQQHQHANSSQQFGAVAATQSNVAAVQQAQQNNLVLNRAQLEQINAAISRTNAAVASHLLSPAHGPPPPIAPHQQQQQQQGNSTAMAAKLATLQTLLLSLQQQQQQQQQHQHHQFAFQQRIQQQQQQQAAAAVAAANKNQQKLVQSAGRISAQNHHFGGLSSAQFMHHQNQAQRHGHGYHQEGGGQQPQNEQRVVERRRAASDDYIQSICSQKYTDEYIQQIQIPVPEALNGDPSFRPLTEQQVIQQVLQNKKYENQSIGETMAQLCKKLAEKRVFGSRLMSKTTVAAPNHSSYSNLPQPGIIYIYHVCQKVLLKKIGKEEEFKEYFRDAMRKLAARCRRVRHARKNLHHKHGGGGGAMELTPVTAAILVSQPPFQQFAGRSTTTTTIGVAGGNAQFTGNEAAAATISAALAELAARQQQNQREYSLHSTLALAHLENNSLTKMAPTSSSGPSLLAQIENGIGQQSFLDPTMANDGKQKQGIEQMEIGESHMDDEEDDDEEEHLGQLSSPTISSESTGASTAHQPSPGNGDGDTSEASDSAHQMRQKEDGHELMIMKQETDQHQNNDESSQIKGQQMQMDTAGF